MELRIKDRLFIPALLPKEGTFKQFNLKKSILAKVEISDRERKEINLRENVETKRIEWDVDKDIPMEPLFTHEEMEYLKESCEKLSGESLPDEIWATIEAVYNCNP